jgi:hypothetical protein
MGNNMSEKKSKEATEHLGGNSNPEITRWLGRLQLKKTNT